MKKLLIILLCAGCASSRVKSINMDNVVTVRIISFGSDVEEISNQSIDIEIDPGLATKELPNISIDSSASVGWSSITINNASEVLVVRIFENGRFNDFAKVLDSFPFSIEWEDPDLYTITPMIEVEENGKS